MSTNALRFVVIVLFTSFKFGGTQIAIPKCCLQNEIVTLDAYCADTEIIPTMLISDDSSKFVINHFNYTFEYHNERFLCEYSNEVQIEFCMTKEEFSTNFNLKRRSIIKNNIEFELTDRNYCVDYVTNGHIIVKMCQSDYICSAIPCVNRCCPPGHVWWNEVDNCKKARVYNTSALIPEHNQLDTDPLHGVRIKNLTCKRAAKSTPTGYYFDTNWKQKQEDLNSFEYCSATLQTLTTQFMYVTLCAASGGTLEEVKFIGTLISILGILASIIFYAVVPELLDLHGKLVLSLLVTMLFAYTSLAFGHNLFFTMAIGCKCTILGYIIYLTALSMFSWSNTLCFNIYRLSAIRNRDSSRNEEKLWYRRYCIFTVCYPLTMTICLIVLDQWRGISKWLKPNIGTQVCFFADTSKHLSSYLILFFIPSGIQILLNWVFFGLLVKKIIQTIRMLNIGRRFLPFSIGSKLFVMAKLCLVMGLPWTLELALFFWQKHSLKLVADLINTTSGFMFFLVFVLTKSTFSKCRKRYDVKKRVKSAVKVLPGTPHTSLTSLQTERGSNPK